MTGRSSYDDVLKVLPLAVVMRVADDGIGSDGNTSVHKSFARLIRALVLVHDVMIEIYFSMW